jgi:integrase
LLEHLRRVPSRRPTGRLDLVLTTTIASGGSATRLAPATVNRIFAAISSFYEYLIVSGRWPTENPIQQRPDPALARVPDRHRPFMGLASHQRPVRRVVRVRTIQRLPRPLDEEQVAALLGSLKRWRDRAMMLLMLHGGLRPGEVLSLHLDDVHSGRRRVIVRYHTDHPKGARTKSRTERVVDLHESATLETVSRYVMDERPRDAQSPFVFLVGGQSGKRCEPLSYAALVRLFQRRCDALGHIGTRRPGRQPRWS